MTNADIATPFDATPAAVPGPRAVCFIYHAFNASLLATLLRNLEAQLQAGLQHVFLVYCNPVHGGESSTAHGISRAGRPSPELARRFWWKVVAGTRDLVP